MGAAGGEDIGRVGVKHAVVVGLPVPGEDLPDVRVQGVAVSGEACLHHPQAAVGHDRAAQRRVGLQPDDQLVLPVDVAGGVAGDRGRGAGIDVVDAARPLVAEHRGQPRPQRAGALGRAGQERRVTGVGGEVDLDEVPDVDLVPPATAGETLPRVGEDVAGLGPDRLDRRAHVVFLSAPVRYFFLLLLQTYNADRLCPEGLSSPVRGLPGHNGPDFGPCLGYVHARCRAGTAWRAGGTAGRLGKGTPGWRRRRSRNSQGGCRVNTTGTAAGQEPRRAQAGTRAGAAAGRSRAAWP